MLSLVQQILMGGLKEGEIGLEEYGDLKMWGRRSRLTQSLAPWTYWEHIIYCFTLFIPCIQFLHRLQLFSITFNYSQSLFIIPIWFRLSSSLFVFHHPLLFLSTTSTHSQSFPTSFNCGHYPLLPFLTIIFEPLLIISIFLYHHHQTDLRGALALHLGWSQNTIGPPHIFTKYSESVSNFPRLTNLWRQPRLSI